MTYSAVREHLERAVQTGLVPGTVCLIKKNEHIVFHEAFGHALRRPARNMNPDTVFDIASLTKLVTTTIILRLITEEKLSLDDSIPQRLPYIRQYDALNNRLSEVTVRHLLTHSSGLPAWFPFYSRSKEGFYPIMNDIAAQSAIEENAVYSDLNFILLGEIIVHETGGSLREAVDRYIREPLGLRVMHYGPLPPNAHRVAATEAGNQFEQAMCRKRDVSFQNWRNTEQWIQGEVNDGNCYYYFNGEAGHAGLFSHARDLVRLADVYRNHGRCEGRTYIDAGLIEQALTDQGEARGLGWQFSAMFPEGCGHTGFTGTSLWVAPVKGLSVVLLTNRLHSDTPQSLQAFREELHQHILQNDIH
ncbi:serine hydrolase [Thalassobacillus sp. CUG 92003]|uniref:serine hydrolase domain-containing protein n=1 Tax=Thalassobacillus sp. CUG 92003 TaxID=2736641 RepID=UPI0015E76B75|nr:serine hydrolase domain-containing protein [Thalassobacillus sp. CUG 92003]